MLSNSGVGCSVLQDPEYGTVSVSATTYDSVANYSCNTGYALTGDEMRMCQISGVWSGNETICTSKNH